MFMGDTGTGKTFFACCIANALIRKGVAVWVTTMKPLLRKAGDFSKADEVMRQVQSIDLLILDDFGTSQKGGLLSMTNEQLAVLIKQGEQERTPELWENVRKLLYKLSFHQYTAHADLFKQQGLSLEDIQQESYFAMLGAIEAYNPEKGYMFTTYLNLQLKRRLRSILRLKDPLNREDTRSLDAPLEDENEDSDTLHDVTADPTSGALIAAFDQRESYRLLHEAVSLLPGGLKEVIKLLYFENLTLKQVGERQGRSIEAVR